MEAKYFICVLKYDQTSSALERLSMRHSIADRTGNSHSTGKLPFLIQAPQPVHHAIDEMGDHPGGCAWQQVALEREIGPRPLVEIIERYLGIFSIYLA